MDDPSRLKGSLRSGDLLVNSTGEGTVGRSLVFDGGDGYLADGHVTVIRFRPEEFDPHYAAYVVNTPAFQAYLDAWFILGATKQTELTAGRFQNAVFPVPPRDEQQSIVAFLQNHDARLSELERLVARLGVFQVGRSGLLADRRNALVSAAVTGQVSPEGRATTGGAAR